MKTPILFALVTSAIALSPLTLRAEQFPVAAAGNPDQSDLHIALAKVSLYTQTNKLDEAAALLDKLKLQYPDNPQVLEAEADLNLLIGNRGAAFAALNKAQNLDPANEDIQNRQRAAILEQGPFAAAGYQYRHTGEANEQFAHATAQAAITPSVSAQINVENDYLHTTAPITTVNGLSRDFSENHQRGNITLGKVFGDGNEANASVYAANRVIGGGGQVTLWDHYGATSIEGNLRKPDWDYVATVIQDGTKDNIRLERKQIITNHLLVILGGGYNHYNLHNDSDVARAAAWDLNVAYTHPYSFNGKPGSEIIFGANYAVNAEYFTHVQRLTDINGATFKPLPTNSYEIHAVTVSASKDLSSSVFAEGYGGYAIDRLGSNGPLFGAVLEYSPINHLGLELRGSRTVLGGIHNSEKEDLLGVNVKWRW